MNMAKASEADLKMAMDLSGALERLGHRFFPEMPDAIQQVQEGDDGERFDRDDDVQCGRALRHLLEIANRGSLMRVVWGLAVLLDPRNKVVDPDADTLQHHPETIEARAAVSAAASAVLEVQDASDEPAPPALPLQLHAAAVDHAHEILKRLSYHRDGDFFVNVNRVGAEAIHASTVATIVAAARVIPR